MAQNGNGTVKKIIVGVAIIVAGGLTTQAIYNSSRITAVEEQIKSLRGWVDETRKDLDRNRSENNYAHDKIQADIKDQGKTIDAKLTEILRGLRK